VSAVLVGVNGACGKWSSRAPADQTRRDRRSGTTFIDSQESNATETRGFPRDTEGFTCITFLTINSRGAYAASSRESSRGRDG
jgi:hypothetical protein